MTDTKVQRFKFTIPILKTSVKIVKDKDGNEIEERYVEGIASGTELDLHGDRMAPSAIKSMAKSLKQHVIALNAEHDTSWLGELGDINKLAVAENNDLGIKAKLNEMSSAKDLWYALTEKNKKLGLSIGGYVKDYEMVKEGEGDDAKWVRLYKEIDLDHIAVTSSPAYPKSWISNIAKSIKIKDDKKLIMKVREKNEKKSRRSQRDKKLRTLARKIVKKIQVMEADLLLELTYTGLQACDESLLLIIERSLNMAKKDVSLEAEEAKKKAETLATPEDEKSEDKAEDKEEKSKEKTSKDKASVKSKSDKAKSKDVGKEKDGDECDEEECDEPEVKEKAKSKKDKEKVSKKDSGKEVADDGKAELLKTIQEMTGSMKKVLKSNEKLAERVEELETQPAGRKTVEIKKELGDEDSGDKTAEELTKERNKKIEEARKEFKNDPNLFARIQRIRVKYAQKVQD